VIGSVAALGAGASALAATGHSHAPHKSADSSSQGAPAGAPSDLTAAECTALEAAQKAIQADASSIATPVLETYVNNGTITSTQEAALLTLIEQGGPGPGGPGGHQGPGGPPPSGSSGPAGTS
jgi:hypothetical protein